MRKASWQRRKGSWPTTCMPWPSRMADWPAGHTSNCELPPASGWAAQSRLARKDFSQRKRIIGCGSSRGRRCTHTSRSSRSRMKSCSMRCELLAVVRSRMPWGPAYESHLPPTSKGWQRERKMEKFRLWGPCRARAGPKSDHSARSSSGHFAARISSGRPISGHG